MPLRGKTDLFNGVNLKNHTEMPLVVLLLLQSIQSLLAAAGPATVDVPFSRPMLTLNHSQLN